MIIAYHLETGEILADSGSNSAYPLGPPQDTLTAWLEPLGEGVGVLRLHDIDDIALIERMRRQAYRVDPITESIIFERILRQEMLEPDRYTVPADSATPVIITYTAPPGRDTGEVLVEVNGDFTSVELSEGTTAFEVVCPFPGPADIRAGGQLLTIMATEVPA